MEILRSTGIERAIRAGAYSMEIGGKFESEFERALGERPFVLGALPEI